MVQTFSLNEQMCIEVRNDSLCLESSHVCAEWLFAMVERYYFTADDYVVDAINEVVRGENAKVSFTRNGNSMIINGIDKGAKVMVFSANGKACTPRISHTDNGIAVGFDTLPQGVYLVKINDGSEIPALKFINQKD